jgi:diguanylate cyclase (GGDEF)-like protein
MNTSAVIGGQRRRCDKQFTILCIDDESSNLKILSSIFKDHHNVVASKSAHQGLQKALDLHPDIILLDVLMPQESGFELIIKLKQIPELTHIPVIFITGLQNVEDEELGLTLGACDYIQKPFNYAIVQARVNNHLELIRQRKLLEKCANVDSLTELPNRRKWQSDINKLWEFSEHHKTALVLGIIDIDYFKKYNDLYGHQQGDIVLRKVSNAIRRVLFTYKGEIYRCGGEEFYFHFCEQAETQVATILNTCLRAVTDLKISHRDSTVAEYVSISIGAVQVLPSERKYP